MESKSTHRVEIVPVELTPHLNADSLSVVPVFGGGYTYVARTADWQGVTRAAYIPPDSVVEVTRPEFAFLADQSKDGKTARIKAKKLRGVVSFGLMVPVPDDTPLGGDWAGRLGVTHYEPPLTHEAKAKGPSLGGEECEGPGLLLGKYDVDSFRRYHTLFEPGEPVVVSEKADGANSAYVYADGRFHCKSRSRWTREFPDYSHLTPEYLEGQGVSADRIDEIISRAKSRTPSRNIWWQALRDTPALEKFLQAHPYTVVYGEVFGNVNCIKYGLPRNQFAAFDVQRDGRWLDFREAYQLLMEYGVPTVPLLNEVEVHSEWGAMPEYWVKPIPYDFETVCRMAEGPTLVPGAKAGTIREGVVVKPLKERFHASIGRVQLKVVSSAFLEKYR